MPTPTLMPRPSLRLPAPSSDPLPMIAILAGSVAFFLFGLVALFGGGAPICVC